MVITDEMVEAALQAYHQWGGASPWKPHDELDRQGCYSQMRATIEAALAAASD